MTNAKRCDRCGAYFNLDDKCLIEPKGAFDFNKISFVKEQRGSILNTRSYDLCYSCQLDMCTYFLNPQEHDGE